MGLQLSESGAEGGEEVGIRVSLGGLLEGEKEADFSHESQVVGGRANTVL